MHIYIVLCTTAILTVTQSIPIAVPHNDVEDEGITNEKIGTDVENYGDVVAVKAGRSKRQLSIPKYQEPAGGYYQKPMTFDSNQESVNTYQQPQYQQSQHGTFQSERHGYHGESLHTYKHPVNDNLKVGGGLITGQQGVQGAAGGFTHTFSGGGCLYGDDFVLLQDGSKKQVKNLRSSDKVYSVDREGKVVKDEIIMMLHGGPKVEASFYTLSTSSNRSISLTPHHLIMKYSRKEKRSQMVAANELKAGDYLLMSNKEQTEPVEITLIEVVYKTGIYTPMTYKGTLVVNDIAVSCYVKYFNKYNELHTLLYPFRLYYYLMKDVLGLSEEPFSGDLPVPSFVYADDEVFYGTKPIKWLHESKNMLRFVGQDLLLNTFLSI